MALPLVRTLYSRADEVPWQLPPPRSVGISDGSHHYCTVCADGGSGLLTCDTCPRVFHIRCLQALRKRLPQHSWICPTCNSLGVEYAHRRPAPLPPLTAVAATAFDRDSAGALGQRLTAALLPSAPPCADGGPPASPLAYVATRLALDDASGTGGAAWCDVATSIPAALLPERVPDGGISAAGAGSSSRDGGAGAQVPAEIDVSAAAMVGRGMRRQGRPATALSPPALSGAAAVAAIDASTSEGAGRPSDRLDALADASDEMHSLWAVTPSLAPHAGPVTYGAHAVPLVALHLAGGRGDDCPACGGAASAIGDAADVGDGRQCRACDRWWHVACDDELLHSSICSLCHMRCRTLVAFAEAEAKLANQCAGDAGAVTGAAVVRWVQAGILWSLACAEWSPTARYICPPFATASTTTPLAASMLQLPVRAHQPAFYLTPAVMYAGALELAQQLSELTEVPVEVPAMQAFAFAPLWQCRPPAGGAAPLTSAGAGADPEDGEEHSPPAAKRRRPDSIGGGEPGGVAGAVDAGGRGPHNSTLPYVYGAAPRQPITLMMVLERMVARWYDAGVPATAVGGDGGDGAAAATTVAAAPPRKGSRRHSAGKGGATKKTGARRVGGDIPGAAADVGEPAHATAEEVDTGASSAAATAAAQEAVAGEAGDVTESASSAKPPLRPGWLTRLLWAPQGIPALYRDLLATSAVFQSFYPPPLRQHTCAQLFHRAAAAAVAAFIGAAAERVKLLARRAAGCGEAAESDGPAGWSDEMAGLHAAMAATLVSALPDTEDADSPLSRARTVGAVVQAVRALHVAALPQPPIPAASAPPSPRTGTTHSDDDAYAGRKRRRDAGVSELARGGDEPASPIAGAWLPLPVALALLHAFSATLPPAAVEVRLHVSRLHKYLQTSSTLPPPALAISLAYFEHLATAGGGSGAIRSVCIPALSIARPTLLPLTNGAASDEVRMGRSRGDGRGEAGAKHDRRSERGAGAAASGAGGDGPSSAASAPAAVPVHCHLVLDGCLVALAAGQRPDSRPATASGSGEFAPLLAAVAPVTMARITSRPIAAPQKRPLLLLQPEASSQVGESVPASMPEASPSDAAPLPAAQPQVGVADGEGGLAARAGSQAPAPAQWLAQADALRGTALVGNAPVQGITDGGGWPAGTDVVMAAALGRGLGSSMPAPAPAPAPTLLDQGEDDDAERRRSRIIARPNEYDWLLTCLLMDGGVGAEVAREKAWEVTQRLQAAGTVLAGIVAALAADAPAFGPDSSGGSESRASPEVVDPLATAASLFGNAGVAMDTAAAQGSPAAGDGPCGRGFADCLAAEVWRATFPGVTAAVLGPVGVAIPQRATTAAALAAAAGTVVAAPVLSRLYVDAAGVTVAVPVTPDEAYPAATSLAHRPAAMWAEPVHAAALRRGTALAPGVAGDGVSPLAEGHAAAPGASLPVSPTLPPVSRSMVARLTAALEEEVAVARFFEPQSMPVVASPDAPSPASSWYEMLRARIAAGRALMFVGNPLRCEGCRYGWLHVCPAATDRCIVLEDGTVAPLPLLVASALRWQSTPLLPPLRAPSGAAALREALGTCLAAAAAALDAKGGAVAAAAGVTSSSVSAVAALLPSLPDAQLVRGVVRALRLDPAGAWERGADALLPPWLRGTTSQDGSPPMDVAEGAVGAAPPPLPAIPTAAALVEAVVATIDAVAAPAVRASVAATDAAIKRHRDRLNRKAVLLLLHRDDMRIGPGAEDALYLRLAVAEVAGADARRQAVMVAALRRWREAGSPAPLPSQLPAAVAAESTAIIPTAPGAQSRPTRFTPYLASRWASASRRSGIVAPALDAGFLAPTGSRSHLVPAMSRGAGAGLEPLPVLHQGVDAVWSVNAAFGVGNGTAGGRVPVPAPAPGGALPPAHASGSGSSWRWSSIAELEARAAGNASKLILGRSRIDGTGLFASAALETDDIVAEYTGEIVDDAECDRREAEYGSRGLADYMFRLGPNEVIDATMAGCRGRYINHSCDPNCYAVITLPEGSASATGEGSGYAVRPAFSPDDEEGEGEGEGTGAGATSVAMTVGRRPRRGAAMRRLIYNEASGYDGTDGSAGEGDEEWEGGSNVADRTRIATKPAMALRPHSRLRYSGRRVFVYALRRIERGEELTYDYQFSADERKIPCKCGAAACRGTVNM